MCTIKVGEMYKLLHNAKLHTDGAEGVAYVSFKGLGAKIIPEPCLDIGLVLWKSVFQKQGGRKCASWFLILVDIME